MKKLFWRALWLLAIALGGTLLVKISLEILGIEDRKYFEI